MSLNWQDWPVPFHSSPETVKEVAEGFQYFDDDVIVSTFHKSGTTLTQQMVSCLMIGIDETRQKRLWNRAPFLEYTKMPEPPSPLELTRDLPRPRMLKTHLPPAFHVRHLRGETGPKNVIVMRNPKDVVVSAFHHFTNNSRYSHRFPATFPEFWRAHTIEPQKFNIQDFFDFNLSWWSFRDHPRVLIIFYEDLIRDRENQFRRLAEFLGVTLTGELLQQAMEVTSFDSMKTDENVNSSLRANSGWKPGFSFIRKGQIGDWKNHFNEADLKVFDSIIEERLRGTGLTFTYE